MSFDLENFHYLQLSFIVFAEVCKGRGHNITSPPNSRDNRFCYQCSTPEKESETASIVTETLYPTLPPPSSTLKSNVKHIYGKTTRSVNKQLVLAFLVRRSIPSKTPWMSTINKDKTPRSHSIVLSLQKLFVKATPLDHSTEF